jgi:hypothetical protein
VIRTATGRQGPLLSRAPDSGDEHQTDAGRTRGNQGIGQPSQGLTDQAATGTLRGQYAGLTVETGLHKGMTMGALFSD